MDKVNINLSAIFHHSGGYSELARNLAEVLSDLGVLAHIDSRGVEGNFHPMPVASYASQKFMKIHASLLDRKSFYDQPNIVMQFVPPFMMAPPKELLSIGVTMFETRVPEGWYKQLDNVKYLMLHDQFQKDLFAKASPAQWSWEPWVCDPRDSFAKDEIFDSPIPGPFFLTVGVARVHKNQSKIIQAFKEFRLKYPEFYLVIKAIVEDHEYDDYRKELAEDDHIIVIPGPYSTKAMDLLYMTCAAYISASMCEGLDMPAIKAVKCNKPVLIARHTGHEDWVPEGLRTLATKTVDMSEMPNIHPRYREKGMMGFDTTVDSILCGMRDMVKSPELFLMSLGERFTYEACKKSMEKNIDILKKL